MAGADPAQRDLGLVGMAEGRLLRRRPAARARSCSASAAPCCSRFAPWRIKLSLSRPVVVALAALTALGVWALLSALWSPAPDIAIGDGQRILVYALCLRARGRALQPARPADAARAASRWRPPGAFAGVIADRSRCATGEHPRDCSRPTARSTSRSATATRTPPSSRSRSSRRSGSPRDRDLDWRLRAAGAGDRDPMHRPRAARPEPRLGAGDGRRPGRLRRSPRRSASGR